MPLSLTSLLLQLHMYYDDQPLIYKFYCQRKLLGTYRCHPPLPGAMQGILTNSSVKFPSTEARGGWSRVISLWHKIMQPSIVLRFEACLTVSKEAHCIEKVWKGDGMLWYGYTIGLLKCVGWISSTLSLRSRGDWWPVTNLLCTGAKKLFKTSPCPYLIRAVFIGIWLTNQNNFCEVNFCCENPS